MISSDIPDDGYLADAANAKNVMKFAGEERRKRHDVRTQDDPAPDPVELASNRASELANNISSSALDQLRQARDDIDNLMRSIKARQEAVASDIVALAQFATDAIQAKLVISDGIQRLSERIRPKAAPTITQG